MTLQFRALVTIPSGDTVQVWASQSADCTQAASRGSGTVATCWRLNAGLGALILTNQAESFNVRVQDIIGGQATVGTNPTTPVSFGASACSLQSSYAATQFNIYIMAIESDGITEDGTAWNYPLPVDVIGPPAPAITKPGVGDTLLLVQWTPNSDSDTGGYDVFVDPPPGTAVSADAATDAAIASNATLVCPEAGTSVSSTSSTTTSDTAASTDTTSGSSTSSTTATTSSSSASSADTSASPTSGCFFLSNVPANGSNGCTSTVFASSSLVIDSGIVATTTTDDGAVVESDASVESGSGGIATITCNYLVGTSCPAGQPAYTATNESVTGETASSYTLTGLVDGVNYNVTVAAVDNFGNLGPLAGQNCAVPQPVTDFFKAYREAGGDGGGGFCSVESVGHTAGWGFGLGFAGVALVSSRRRRRSAR